MRQALFSLPENRKLRSIRPGSTLNPAGRKLLVALAQHAPGHFSWGQAATLAGIKPSGGHFNAGRKSLRDSGYVAEGNDLIAATEAGLKAAGEVSEPNYDNEI